MNNTNANYILYDSKCKFCSASVSYFLSKNLSKNLLALPIQNKEARTILRKNEITFVKLNTIYFVEKNCVYVKSLAIFKIISYLKFPIRFINVFSIFPIPFTDIIYDWVAKNRHKIVR